MNDKLHNVQMDRLFDAILGLETREDCYRFFEDLCTFSELRSMSQRFYVAKLLSDRRIYSDISQETGASTATISRVNRSLTYGNDGYHDALKRLADAEKAENAKK